MQVFQRRRAVGDQRWSLVLVDCPENAQVVASDLLEGKSTGKNLPEDNSPTEDVALLTVVDPLKHLGSHPGRAALVVGHDGGLVAGRPEVTDLECQAVVDQQQVGRFQVSMNERFWLQIATIRFG